MPRKIHGATSGTRGYKTDIISRKAIFSLVFHTKGVGFISIIKEEHGMKRLRNLLHEMIPIPHIFDQLRASFPTHQGAVKTLKG